MRSPRPQHGPPRRRAGIIVAAIVTAILVMSGAAAATVITVGQRAPDATAAASTTPSPPPIRTPPPLTPAQQLLASTGDPRACVVTFAGDGVVDPPMLQTEGTLYAGLPIPAHDGRVFAGWYATPEDAANLAIPGRVNGAEMVACLDRQVTLTGAWTTPEANAAENARIPILMYHQFTTKPEGEDH